MGEVKTQVRLINAADESLARGGRLPQEQVRVYETEALVDTGAVSTVIPTDVAQALGLDATHRRVVSTRTGGKTPSMWSARSRW